MKVKNTKAYEKLRILKRKFLTYFSDQGLITRKVHHFIAKNDPLVKVGIRKCIYENIKKKSTKKVCEIVNQIEKKGYAFLKLEDLGISGESVFEFCENMVENFQKNIHDPSFLGSLPQAKYNDKTIAYAVYQKNGENDPLLEFAKNETLISIATLYMQHLPLLENVSFTYNPVHGTEQFGSQVWHRDSHHKKILKLFFSPLNITKKNGPFEFFPPSLSTLNYYKDLPQGMSDERIEVCGLDVNCAIKFLSKKFDILLIDTERCLHRGGLTQEPRFLGTISYTSPLYSFTPKQYRKTATYRLTFEYLKKENEELINKYLYT